MKFLAALVVLSSACAQDPVTRPAVLGVAHVAVYVKDLARTRQFYEEFLGLGEPFTLPTKDGKGVRIAFVKINDRQYIEIFTEPDRGEGQLNHISFYTDDADRMLAYLKSKGAPIVGSVERVGKGLTGNKNFNVKDPDGHIVEIVEYQPDSWTSREKGKFMPATRIAEHMMHAGVLCGDLNASLQFYGGVLGFREFWRGSSSVNLRPAEGQDYLELMLSDKNHVSLTVPDLQKALVELERRAAKGLYSGHLAIEVGVNGTRHINLYDPDGTRVELMEADAKAGQAKAPALLVP